MDSDTSPDIGVVYSDAASNILEGFSPAEINQGIIKFEKVLATPLAVGSRLVCVGTPTEEFPWFSVNIGRGDITSCADIAVRFHVRFPEGQVARNTYNCGSWGTEETAAFRPFPFIMGQKFRIEVLVYKIETLWIVNGQYYCSYAHRKPSPLSGMWVQVTDLKDVLLDMIPIRPGLIEISTPTAENQSNIKFTQSLAEPLTVGTRVICTGTPRPNIPWFAVNIGCGDIIPSAEMAVHFNVRFNYGQIVRNTRHWGSWGVEEVTASRPLPFQVGQQFTIEVQVHDSETLWIVNGELYCSYAHRNPSPLRATWLQTTGLKHVTVKIHPPFAPHAMSRESMLLS